MVSLGKKTRYNNHAYRKRNAALKAHVGRTNEPCWLCGQPIDLMLPYTHPMSFTADHVEAIANGGKLLSELRPAHRRCNSSRGRKRVDELISRPKTTRTW
ncbi:HNH endonuclease [Rothia nasimurium]|uniref:HNH endonuclease n=1 Tax=Rothia nasimurium TaxID=85336 RepID=UPI003606BDBD